METSLIFLIGRSIVCYDALSFETSTSHFVQRIEVWQRMNMSNQNFYLKKRNGNCSDFLNFFSKRGSICFNSSIFFARDISNYILAGNFEENFVKIFAENVVSGNSVQIGPNFPAKSLSIYTKNFFHHMWLKRIWDKTLCLIVYWILQNNKRWHKLITILFIDLFTNITR